MTSTNASFPAGELAQQVAELLHAGGTLGDLLNYTEQDYELLYSFGHSLYSQARYMDAVKVFGYLTMHNHLEFRYAFAYASSLQMIKKYEDAIQFYTMASVMDMSDPLPTFHTCECMLAIGNIDDAKQGLEMVVGQCKTDEQQPLKSRAQALLDLIQSSLAKAAKASKE